MNLNGDEKKIRLLFGEMSLDDQRRAPGFASVLAAARSVRTRSQNREGSLRFAMAVAMVCAALLIAMAIIVRPSKPQAARDHQASAPAVQPEAQPGDAPSQPRAETPKVEPRRTTFKRARPRRTPDQTAIAMKSLFAWRSPTASLLPMPGDELLRSLPRLGESLQTIKSFSPDQFN
jgi:hypothetical protein